jgi:hypothetical protein
MPSKPKTVTVNGTKMTAAQAADLAQLGHAGAIAATEPDTPKSSTSSD